MRLLAIIATVTLAGCNDVPHVWSESNIRDMAGDEAEAIVSDRESSMQAKLEAMEGRIKALEDANVDLAVRAANARNFSEKIADQVANNARVQNQNSVKDMTARGACGYRRVNDPRYPNSVIQEPIQCTESDLTR